MPRPEAASSEAAAGPAPDVSCADEATGPAPLVVLFHGGAWRARYDRWHLSPLAAFLAGRGFAVASVEYRRGGEERAEAAADGAPKGRQEAADSAPDVPPPAGRWPETFDDIAAAVDALPELVRTRIPGRADPDRIVLCGHSAGGHAALWAAARHRLPTGSRWHLPSPPPVLGVVALAPIADFRTARDLRVCSDAVDELLGGAQHMRARSPHADPAALLPTGIATTIVQGATDIDVPPQVAEAFAAAATRSGQPVRLTLLAQTGHFPLIDPAAPAADTVAAELARVTGPGLPGH
ncbi:S9 family peptidase [Streptomyces sp. XD-27]|uniref:alpha/beta hydrolase family protein n=1 Tax=Streptomyces sp. XD-27 TaxID=3062779 RepID=UPI0026F44EF8|nr:alpha/beta hydrolase fold domain-containing protein [Streptomyces sp. XD-27]WKX74306.1 alpha/beta hydrolase fold domain-containing protein [Streptomyces sp. XD-27]